MHVDLPALIQSYGYPLVFLGALLEGETVLTVAGLAVHRGHLAFLPVWLLAAAGATAGDAFFFALGRRYGTAIFQRFPRLAPGVVRIDRLVRRGPAVAVIGVRFLYGMRVAGPVVIGTGALPWPRFLLLNACGGLLWSACWVSAGYGLGEVAKRWLGDLVRHERSLFLGVFVVAVAVIAILRLRPRAAAPAAADPH